MKHCFLLFTFLLSLTVTAQEQGWQLGTPDNSAKEFQPYSALEFQTSAKLLNSPNYDKKSGTFTFNIPQPGLYGNPDFPAALTGATYGNNTPVHKLKLVWNETSDGFRKFEFRIIAAEYMKSRMAAHRRNPNANLDIDGQTWVESGIKVYTPGKRGAFQIVPYDIERQEKRTGKPLIVKLTFPVKAGENVIELAETSGATHWKICSFDYFKLTPVNEDSRPAVFAEFKNPENFLNSSVYKAGDNAKSGLEIRNLAPESITSGTVEFIDYKGNIAATRNVKLNADADGFARAAADVPENLSGHFRVRFKLTESKKVIAETRIAGVRMVAPLTGEEIDLSFIGVCGIDLGMFVLPDQAPEAYNDKFRNYALWQKILQVHHERIHSLCWSFAEPAEHDYRWGPWDRLIKSQTDNDIRVQLAIIGTPKWLMERHFPGRKYKHVGNIYFAPPPDMEKWRNFCALVAKRYGDKVKEFEIWNEVSEQSMFWAGGNARQYVELVKNASEAIKSQRPEAKIIAETMWPRQDEFIRQLFELGIAKYVDVHADHYMTDSRIATIPPMLEKYAPGAVLIDNESQMDTPRNPLGQVDETSRVEAAETLIRKMLYSNAHGVKRIYTYRLIGNVWRMWGMVGPDNTPKYTFSVFKTLLNRTAGARFERYMRLSGSLELFLYRYVTPGRAEANGGEFLAVLCNDSRKPETLLLPALSEECKVIDIMDNTRTLAAPNCIAKLEVGSAPVMLAGLDAEALDKLARLNIRSGKADLQPGEPAEFEISLPEGAGGKFTVERSDGKKQSFILKAGERRKIASPTEAKQNNKIMTLKLSGELELPERKLPVLRYFQYVISNVPLGVSIFPPLGKQDWQVWGGAKATFAEDTVTVDINAANTTGALRPVRALKVIPGARYLLDFRGRGAGRLRVMLNGIDTQGNTRTLSHNFLSPLLAEQWGHYRKEWICPKDINRIEVDFYEYREKGKFELADLKFIRLHDDRPVNRQLYKVNATASTPPLDGKLTGFPADSFRKLTEITFERNPENPMSAQFAVAADARNLYVAVRVKDKVHVSGPTAGELWKGDSVQFDIDLTDGSQKVRAVEFGMALVSGKPVSYRYRTLPSQDIVMTYRTGENPAGVRVNVTRQRDETFYEIAIPAEAIHPKLKLMPGMKLGFALLVNQNDGQRREGFMRWGGTIGDMMIDNREFGELALPDKLKK